MKKNDYKITFGSVLSDLFQMEWIEGGREYRLRKNETSNTWVVAKLDKNAEWQDMEYYEDLHTVLEAISSYSGPCEEPTMELYEIIREVLA